VPGPLALAPRPWPPWLSPQRTAAFGASGVASIVATVLMQDYTNRDIWEETV
jgi:hypothetical protein